MAKIVLSDTAPSGQTQFSTAQAEFEVPYETSDPDILANARVHPWLEVVEDEPDGVQTPDVYVLPQTTRFDANDPEAVREELARRGLDEVAASRVAIDAALDQDEPVTVEPGIAVTTAAADAADTTTEEHE